MVAFKGFTSLFEILNLLQQTYNLSVYHLDGPERMDSKEKLLKKWLHFNPKLLKPEQVWVIGHTGKL